MPVTPTYSKELVTVWCERLVKAASDLLATRLFDETSDVLTQGEKICLEQLIPQLNITAELFRQCSKNSARTPEDGERRDK